MKNGKTAKVIVTAFVMAVIVTAVHSPAFAAETARSAKAVNMSVYYGINTFLALVLAGSYCFVIKKKDIWLLFLHASVFVVNLGYFTLSLSKALPEALLANRISYLGSVFLPLCMLMSIMSACRTKWPKWLPALLVCCSVGVFILAASPGYLDCYYKEVSLVFINGMAKLEKVYGPLHFVYPIYLAVYFGVMIAVILVSVLKKKVASHKHAIILLTVVFLNLAIWLVEQLIYTELEFLSVSYIVSELLLLLLFGMMQDYGIPYNGQTPEPLPAVSQEAVPTAALEGEVKDETHENEDVRAELSAERISLIVETWAAEYILTGRECDVLCAILRDKKRKDIAAEMCVTEHTIKKHTGNIFSKLDVSSRSELFAKAEQEVV